MPLFVSPVNPTSKFLHRARASTRCGTHPQAAPRHDGRGRGVGRVRGLGAAARRLRRGAGARVAVGGVSLLVVLPWAKLLVKHCLTRGFSAVPV
ncbi:hypothetical protein ACP70R_012969 [Stipagrostis hirtigluma subsp. patula]